MTIYKRPSELVFADSAKAGEVIAFPDIARGWGITFEQTDGEPPMEWFNSLTKQQFEAVRYLMQRGVSEWSTTEDYPLNALVQFDNQFYISLQANKGKNPNTSIEHWISFNNKYVQKKDILSPFVGMPFNYPLANAPDGWVSMDGAAINPITSPKLASLYGSNLPDLRGVVIRGWDNGRGFDPSRELLSYQDDAMARITGSFQSRRFPDAIGGVVPTPSGNGLFKMIEKSGPTYVPFSPSTGLVATDTMYFDNSFATKTAAENLMKNVAMHKITPIG